jgi:hypothetical protein
MLRRVWILAVILASAATTLAGNKSGVAITKLPTKTVDIKALLVPVPKQHCPNWAWAAVVEMMLARQDVTIKQTEWILRANAGELCIETTPDLDQIKRVVTMNHVQPDGSKIHIKGIVNPDATDVGYLVTSVRDQRPLMMLIAGRVLVLQSLDYDEYIYPNNQRMFEIVKMTLLDPFGGKPVVFDKATDDTSQIGGVFEVRVGPIEPFQD